MRIIIPTILLKVHLSRNPPISNACINSFTQVYENHHVCKSFMSMGAKENKSICKVVLKIKGGQFSYLPSASLQPTAITDFLLKNQNALQKRLNKYSKEKTT